MIFRYFVLGMKSVEEKYGSGLDNVSIITLAPELPGSLDVVEGCVGRGEIVFFNFLHVLISNC